MTPGECPREPEVVEATAARRWPDGVALELRDHVIDCPTCRDVAAVALALAHDAEAAWDEVRVPSSARVWWRAQMRARQEAIAAAGRPITWAQGLCGACGVGIAGAVAMSWRQIWWDAVPLPASLQHLEVMALARDGWASTVGTLAASASNAFAAAAGIGAATGLEPATTAALALLLLATPAALYFVLVSDRSSR